MADTNMVRVNEPTYRKLRNDSLRLQFEVGRQISMGELIQAALQVADRHKSELNAIIHGATND